MKTIYFLLACFLAVPCLAQINNPGGGLSGVSVSGTPTTGQVPTATSSSAATWQTAPVAMTLDVEAYVLASGNTDIAVGINNACIDLPTAGGILDARRVPMPMYWNSNPFTGNTCTNKHAVTLLLNAGDVCYSKPIVTTTNHFYVIGAGNNNIGTTGSAFGTMLIPQNSTGMFASRCSGSPFSDFSTTKVAAMGGPFANSYIGPNGLVTVSTMSASAGTVTIKGSGTLPLNFCSATACPPNASSSPGATYVYIGGNAQGGCDGAYQVTGISTTTTTDDTFTVTNAACTAPAVGNTFVMAANAVVGIYDGQYGGQAVPTAGQWCAGGSYEHVWQNLTLTGNGIASFAPFFNCGSEEGSNMERVFVHEFTLAGVVDDSTSFWSSTGGGASHVARHGVFPQENTTTGGQKCTITGITSQSATATYNDVETIACSVGFATSAPSAGGWVYVMSGNSGLTPGFYQVVASGMGGCLTTPSTTAFCLSMPGQTSTSVGTTAVATFGPIGMVMEGFKPNVNQLSGGYNDCCWDTAVGGSTTTQLWMIHWLNGVEGSIGLREHDEQYYNAAWDVGEGNAIDKWLSTSTNDVTVGINLQNIDGGGSNIAQGPGWGTTGTTFNGTAVVRLGAKASGASLLNITDLFANAIYADARNQSFLVGSTTPGDAQTIGPYNQGIQPTPACYSATGTCQAQASGIAQIPTSGATVVISTSAVSANSNIQVNWMVGNAGGLTCSAPANLSSLGTPYVSARTAGTSFTITDTTATTPTTNAACVGWFFTN